MSISILPINMVAGSIVLWFTVPKNALAKCGITTPTKAMGPVNAVTVPVKTAAIEIIIILALLIFSPALRA